MRLSAAQPVTQRSPRPAGEGASISVRTQDSSGQGTPGRDFEADQVKAGGLHSVLPGSFLGGGSPSRLWTVPIRMKSRLSSLPKNYFVLIHKMLS